MYIHTKAPAHLLLHAVPPVQAGGDPPSGGLWLTCSDPRLGLAGLEVPKSKGVPLRAIGNYGTCGIFLVYMVYVVNGRWYLWYLVYGIYGIWHAVYSIWHVVYSIWYPVYGTLGAIWLLL